MNKHLVAKALLSRLELKLIKVLFNRVYIPVARAFLSRLGMPQGLE